MQFIPKLSFDQWANEMERALVFYNKNAHLPFEERLKKAVRRGIVSAEGAERIRAKRAQLKFEIANPQAIKVSEDKSP